MNIIMISRDARVHKQFRSSWINAFIRSGHNPIVLLRSKMFSVHFLYTILLAKLSYEKLVVYGTSEALLFGLFRPNLVVITGLGRLLLQRNRNRKLFFKLLKVFYLKTDIVVLNSADYRIFKALRFTNVIKINGEGVDLDRYHYRSERKKYHNIKRSTTFCYAGRLIKSKNVHLLIEYFDKILRDEDGIRVIFVGDNDFSSGDSVSEDLIIKFRERHIGKVNFLGYNNEMEKILEDVDVFINLSEREGLPFSVVEALASGCRCILSNVPGNQEFRLYDEVILVKNENEFSNAVGYFSKNELNRTVPDLKRFSSRNVEREIVNYVRKHL